MPNLRKKAEPQLRLREIRLKQLERGLSMPRIKLHPYESLVQFIKRLGKGIKSQPDKNKIKYKQLGYRKFTSRKRKSVGGKQNA